MKLSKRKAEIIDKALDDENTSPSDILKFPLDRDGTDLSLKHLKLKGQSRGFVEKQEINANVTIPKVVVEIVRTDSDTED